MKNTPTLVKSTFFCPKNGKLSNILPSLPESDNSHFIHRRSSFVYLFLTLHNHQFTMYSFITLSMSNMDLAISFRSLLLNQNQNK